MKMNRKIGYQLFKYSVYLAVLTNVFLFLIKDGSAAAHRLEGSYTFAELISAYVSTIDTSAWAILLILFELETYVIPVEKLKKGLQWLFMLIRGACYAIVLTSLWGYISGFIWLQGFESVTIGGLCEVIGQSWMIELDEFKTIGASDCSTLAKGEYFFRHAAKAVYTDNVFLNETFWLAGIDVLNSFAWILVVIALEVDVWLQLKNRLVGRAFTFSKYFKNVLYGVLFFAAVYWGIFGDFLEFWDAFLWIVAFFFIEMNILEWRKGAG